MSGKRKSLNQRVLEKIERIPFSGCWIWMAHIDPKGYGRININGIPELAHRITFGIYKGIITNNLCVLHRCDIPSCVNPDHLFLGTIQENNKDMASKMRSTIGERNPNAKLTESQIKNILLDTRPQKTIAADYFVDQSTISYIKSRRIWKYV